MTTPISPTDTQAPSAPANLVATGALSSVALSWSASSDNVGVTRYDLYRSTHEGFTPSAANRIAQPTGRATTTPRWQPAPTTTRCRQRTPPATSLASSNEASAVVGDTSPPTAPGTLTATGAVGKATLPGCSDRQRRGTQYDVYRSSTSGFTPTVANRIAQPTGRVHRPTAPGTYYYRVAAEDAARATSARPLTRPRQPCWQTPPRRLRPRT